MRLWMIGMALAWHLAAADNPAAAPKPEPPSGAASAPNPAETQEADESWRQLIQASRPLPRPPEWQSTQPSEAAVQEYHRRNAEVAKKAAQLALGFHTRFPGHEKAGEARLREYLLWDAVFQLGSTNHIRELLAAEKRLWEDGTVPDETRVQIFASALNRFPYLPEVRDHNETARLEEGGRRLLKDLPGRPELYKLLLDLVHYQIRSDELVRAKALLDQLAASDKAPEQIRLVANAELKQFALQGKPLEMKFTAMDGREVDLVGLQGKVVLIDFWATWCPPCMASLPGLKVLYEKLKPQGFEILGINLDSNPATVTQVIERSQLTWPQFFDGQGEENRFAVQFGIVPLPTMWLVDKKGKLRELNAIKDMEQKIERLLAEKL